MADPRMALTAADLAAIDARLAPTDELLALAYPGDDGSRQPVHTVYVPADRYAPELPAVWGRAALAAAETVGGIESLATLVGLEARLAASVAPRVREKLAREPIEDLRIDFEDGYGDRGDDVEDADAIRAAKRVAASEGAGLMPPFVGIRFKSFEAATRARGIRTLDLFIGGLLEHGGLPGGLTLTLPKVSTVGQVEAMAEVVAALERVHGLPDGRLRFEVQVETPQLILDAQGRSPVARIAHAAPGRVTGLHYGTYDYSASLQIDAGYQSMEHPVADLAKGVMQLAVAGTGTGSPTGRRTSCPSATAPPTPGACTPDSCAVHSSAGSPRAGTCMRTSFRRGSSRRTRTTAGGTQWHPVDCGRTSNVRPAPVALPERPARSSMSRRLPALSPASCCAACAAARSRSTR